MNFARFFPVSFFYFVFGKCTPLPMTYSVIGQIIIIYKHENNALKNKLHDDNNKITMATYKSTILVKAEQREKSDKN